MIVKVTLLHIGDWPSTVFIWEDGYLSEISHSGFVTEVTIYYIVLKETIVTSNTPQLAIDVHAYIVSVLPILVVDCNTADSVKYFCFHDAHVYKWLVE